MKLRKTAVAVAIAGIAAAPMVATASTTLSGLVQIKLQGNDADTGADPEPGDPTIAAGDVLFGISTNGEMNNGLTGYGSLRADFDALSNQDNGDDADDVDVDSVYTGIKGGFGDLRFGEVPLAVEVGQVANDIFDVGAEISGGISYSGSFGPVSLVANFSPENNQDAIGIGAKFGIGGFSIGVGAEDRAELQNIAAGVSFAYAGASIAAHFWSKEEGNGDGDLESVSVKVGYGFGGVAASLTVSAQEDDGATDDEAIRLDLVYDLGGGTEISSRITAASDNTDGGEDVTDWRIQLTKFF